VFIDHPTKTISVGLTKTLRAIEVEFRGQAVGNTRLELPRTLFGRKSE
jgi:hypothetical protein